MSARARHAPWFGLRRGGAPTFDEACNVFARWQMVRAYWDAQIEAIEPLARCYGLVLVEHARDVWNEGVSDGLA